MIMNVNLLSSFHWGRFERRTYELYNTNTNPIPCLTQSKTEDKLREEVLSDKENYQEAGAGKEPRRKFLAEKADALKRQQELERYTHTSHFYAIVNNLS